MAKKRFAQVGVGGRARFFYHAVAETYSETSELVGFCDVNQTRMDYANSYLESMGVAKVPTYKHYDFDKMIEETKPDTVIVTSVDRTHDYYIIRAMELGCNVITEKHIVCHYHLLTVNNVFFEISLKNLRIFFKILIFLCSMI